MPNGRLLLPAQQPAQDAADGATLLAAEHAAQDAAERVVSAAATAGGAAQDAAQDIAQAATGGLGLTGGCVANRDLAGRLAASLREDGCEVLTRAIPRTAEEVEAACSG